jgi:hypothetical protein
VGAAKVRSEWLAHLPALPRHLCAYARLHPLRQGVVRGLGRVLDDRKRVLRRAAAKVRNEWLVMDE